MRQVIQSLRDGAVDVVDVPSPALKTQHVLIRTERSVISTGTESSLTQFARSSWTSRAMQQPERVRQVVQKATTDGIPATIKAVTRRLDEPVALGYANAGVVVAVGEGVEHIAVGDRVASVGAHAEYVCVPKLLVHEIPPNVSSDVACFAPLGAVALHAFRLADVQIGSRVAVIGLGVLGRLTLQIARASGCEAIGFELDPRRAERAREEGFEILERSTATFDAVIVATSSTSDAPIKRAVEICRPGGDIVLLGTADIHFDRAPLFEKEVRFRVSRSLGPGRYDPNYEVHGRDFDLDDVRWTEGRNIATVLGLMADGSIDTSHFDAVELAHHDAATAYDLLLGDAPPLTAILSYPTDAPRDDQIEIPAAIRSYARTSQPAVSVIGAGLFATATLLPALAETDARRRFIASNDGLNASIAAQRFQFLCATTDVERAISSDEVDAVFIATRHDSHVEIAKRALLAGKHVYVEKPLALDRVALDDLEATYRALRRGASVAPVLTVGFNRRFSPLTMWLRGEIAGYHNRQFVMTVHEQELPATHWLLDPARGGGRFVGTACHYIDLLRALSGSAIEDRSIVKSGAQNGHIQLRFENGDIGSVLFSTSGSASFSKERLDVHAGGESWQVDNFQRGKKVGAIQRPAWTWGGPNKGHAECIAAFLEAIGDGVPPIPIDELFEVSRVAIELK